MASTSDSIAGPSSVPYPATAAAVSLDPAPLVVVENGTPGGAAGTAAATSTTTSSRASTPVVATTMAITVAEEQESAPPSKQATPDMDMDMEIDLLPSVLPELELQQAQASAPTSIASVSASAPASAASSSSITLSTPTIPEPPASAPILAPSSSADGLSTINRNKPTRAAKTKASHAIVSLGSDAGGQDGNNNGSISASEAGGPATPALPNTAPNLSRAKRQRNVKFSPAKGPKATGRRAAAAVAAGAIALTGKAAAAAAIEDAQLPNNDYCEVCGGKGHFLCCDGCPRSFHFSCLDPPLELDELPTESWYCRVCEAARKLPIPPKGILGPLIWKVESENPVVFELPQYIKGSFKNVTTGAYGEYVDTNEFRPLSGLGKPGKGGYEDRDPYKTKDRTGRTVLCHRCHEPANPLTKKRIVACDFCEFHWHLDCVDPPLVGMPPITRRWMCPAHADEALPGRRKVLKHQKVIKVKDPQTRNNGDIEIIPMEGRFAGNKHPSDEIISQGLRYQVPEQIVILDFWTKLHRDRYGKPITTTKPTASSSKLKVKLKPHNRGKNTSTAAAASRGMTTDEEEEESEEEEEFDFTDDSSSLTSMEASPEPSTNRSRLDNGNQEDANSPDMSNGAELLWQFARQIEREGTEVSDGDPPDIEAWQADSANANDAHEDDIMKVDEEEIAVEQSAIPEGKAPADQPVVPEDKSLATNGHPEDKAATTVDPSATIETGS